MTGRILCQYPVEPGNYSVFEKTGGINISASSCYCLGGTRQTHQNYLKMCITDPKLLLTGGVSTIMLKSGKYEVALNFSENL